MRKIKKAPKRPPLSLLDKSIYVFLMTVAFLIISPMVFLFAKVIPMKVAYADGNTVTADNLAAVFGALPFCAFVMLSLMISSYYGLKCRQPIFGNKRFSYPKSTPMLRMYPIFSKAFWENCSIKTKKTRKRILKIVLIIFLICCAILPLGICPRETLDKDNNFSTYNLFNVKTHTAHIEDAEELIINIDTSRHRGRRHYHIELNFVFQDKTYNISLGDFYEMENEEALEYMIYLKGFFNEGKYRITNVDRIDSVIKEDKFNARELELVYELFDQK